MDEFTENHLSPRGWKIANSGRLMGAEISGNFDRAVKGKSVKIAHPAGHAGGGNASISSFFLKNPKKSTYLPIRVFPIHGA